MKETTLYCPEKLAHSTLLVLVFHLISKLPIKLMKYHLEQADIPSYNYSMFSNDSLVIC